MTIIKRHMTWLTEEFKFFRYLDIEKLAMNEWEVIHSSERCTVMCKRTQQGNTYKVIQYTGLKEELLLEVYEDNKTKVITRLSDDSKIHSLFLFFTVSLRNKGSLKDLKPTKEEDKELWELKKMLAHFKKYPECLSDEEKHKICVTYTNDLNDLEKIYSSLMEDEKQEANEWYQKSKKFLIKQLGDMKETVKVRKIKMMELKYKVIKKR